MPKSKRRGVAQVTLYNLEDNLATITDMIGIAEASKLANVTKGYGYILMNMGSWPKYVVSGKIFTTRSGVLEWMEKRKAERGLPKRGFPKRK